MAIQKDTSAPLARITGLAHELVYEALQTCVLAPHVVDRVVQEGAVA